MFRLALIGAVALVLGGCPKPKGDTAGPTGPEIPTDFTPPPPLGAEPTADETALGREWMVQVHDLFHERWAETFLENCRVYLRPEHPLNDPSRVALIEFAVATTGTLSGAAVVTSSGVPDFDAAALEVVRESAPFPKPPADLLSDDGLVHVTWRFARDIRQDGLAGARVERREFEIGVAVPALLDKGRFDEAAARLAAKLDTEPGARDLPRLARTIAAAAVRVGLDATDDPAARLEAARVAGAAGWKEAAPSLRKLAREAPDLRLQKEAIVALGALGDAESEAILVEAVEKLDGDRSVAAAGALAKLGKGALVWEKVGARLGDKDARVKAAAIDTIAESGAPQAVDALAAILADRKAPKNERAAAAGALGGIPGDAPAKALTAALADGDASIRAAALSGLARAGRNGLRSRAVYYKLEPLFKDRDPRVRAAAAVAAAHLFASAASAEVVLLARKDKTPQVLAACAEALGIAGGADAVATLEKLARHDAEDVRLAAIRALAAQRAPSVAAFASDQDLRVRALALRGADASAATLALADPAAEVRAAAVLRLAELAKPAPLAPAVRLIGGAPSVRDRVVVAEPVLRLAGE